MSKYVGFTVQDACATILRAMQDAKAASKPALEDMIQREQETITLLKRAIDSGTMKADARIRAGESIDIAHGRLSAMKEISSCRR